MTTDKTQTATPVVKTASAKPASKQTIGYCMKCKEKRVMNDPKSEDMQTKRGVKRIIRGKCSVCNTNMCLTTKPE